MRALSRAVAAGLAALALASASNAATKCPPDSAAVGTACIDVYEASLWSVPLATTANRGLVKKILKGTATLADLTAGEAVQIGATVPPFAMTAPPASFPPNGQWTPVADSDPPSPGLYAASIPGVLPSTALSWFQADQACAAVGKRLLTNLEWQVASASTPDAGALDDGATSCATNTEEPVATGSRSACVSAWGVRDQVGNVGEWVGLWIPAGPDLPPPTPGFPFVCIPYLAGDLSCFGDDASPPVPVGLARGGETADSFDGALSGVFAIRNEPLAGVGSRVGFRCARDRS
jgi:formylglycine-generating enzyme required for sulfatase activity